MSQAPPESLPVHALATLWQGVQAGQTAAVCQVACLSLQRALTHYGIESQLQVVDVTITSDDDRKPAFTIGSPAPRWDGGLWTGHTVLSIPRLRRLVDLTAQQARRLASSGIHRMPIVMQVPDERAWEAGQHLAVYRKPYLLAYHRLTGEQQDTWQGPVVDQYRVDVVRQGDILAGLAVELMAVPDLLPRARRAPYPALQALLDAHTRL